MQHRFLILNFVLLAATLISCSEPRQSDVGQCDVGLFEWTVSWASPGEIGRVSLLRVSENSDKAKIEFLSVPDVRYIDNWGPHVKKVSDLEALVVYHEALVDYEIVRNARHVLRDVMPQDSSTFSMNVDLSKLARGLTERSSLTKMSIVVGDSRNALCLEHDPNEPLSDRLTTKQMSDVIRELYVEPLKLDLPKSTLEKPFTRIALLDPSKGHCSDSRALSIRIAAVFGMELWQAGLTDVSPRIRESALITMFHGSASGEKRISEMLEFLEDEDDDRCRFVALFHLSMSVRKSVNELAPRDLGRFLTPKISESNAYLASFLATNGIRRGIDWFRETFREPRNRVPGYVVSWALECFDLGIGYREYGDLSLPASKKSYDALAHRLESWRLEWDPRGRCWIQGSR